MDFLVSKDLGTSFAMEMLHEKFPWLTPVMHFFSRLGDNDVIRIVAILAILFFVLIGRWRTGVCLAAAFLLAWGIEYSAKPWVNRPRPDLKWVEARDKKSSPSFPSGHALLSMAVYGTLALSLSTILARRKIMILVVFAGLFLPLLIGFSRIYLGVHYMTDVAGGLCAGLGCALLLHWIDQTWSEVGQRKASAETAANEQYELLPPDAPIEEVRHSGGETIQP